MSEQSPTDNGGVQSSSDLQNESQLDNEQQLNSADEQQQDTGSDEQRSDDSDSGSSPSTKSNKDDQSSDDEGLAKFAKGQGFEDISDFTPRELDLLRRQKKQVDAYRNNPDRIKSKDELRKATEAINDPNAVKDDNLSPEELRELQRDMTIAQLQTKERTRDFYDENPQARDYDSEMGKILIEERERNGDAAARYLASDLNRLYILAKARRSEDDSVAAREAGRQEERDLIRKRQEGSADTPHSTSPSTSQTKIDRTWLEAEYDPSNAEHRKLVDEALARGDLY